LLRRLFGRYQVNLMILFYLIGLMRKKKTEHAERQDNASE
jgi:hypothetical protein